MACDEPDAITRNKQRRLDIHTMIRQHPYTVRKIAEAQVAKALLQFQRNLAMAETVAHLAYLRWRGPHRTANLRKR